MWRPKGWKRIKEHRWGDVGLASGMFKTQEIEFEAGADAMLKSLMENSVDDVMKLNGNSVEISFKNILKGNGTWVFIPEE